MNEMIERVAKAIEDAARTTHDGELIDPEKVARAAIAAMREPTEAMIGAVSGNHDIWDGYRLMIDAALSEPEGN